jgi:hypothetical protein
MDAAPTAPTPVEVWVGGDDGLTQKLEDAMESAFRSSQDFTLSSGKKPGTLVVLIPTNVGWKKIGTRTKVLYTVEFRSQTLDGRKISDDKGSCWDGEYAKCAAHIVEDAKTAARKIH